MEKVMLAILSIIGLTVAIAGIALLLAFPVKWTWNVTMPYLFGLPTLTWGKAWCLHFLCGSLIKATNINNNK